MKSYDIAVIGGDGTGPEVTAEALKVAEAAAKKFGFKLNWHSYDFGGERYLKTGEVLPDSAVDELRKFKAMYLGAIGHPQVKPGILEKGILLRLRFELEQYINLRPVKLYRVQDCPLKDKGPEHIDFVVVRENNEGLYIGTGGFVFKNTPHEIAVQESVNTRRGVDRCLKYAYELAKKRRGAKPWKGLKPEDVKDGKTAQLTLFGKTNVLTFDFDLWERAFHEMGAEIPDREARLRPRGRHVHVVREKSGVVRRDRHRQPVWRHHHRPGRDDPGRAGRCRRRQHQSRRHQHVRAAWAAAHPNTPARTSSIPSPPSTRAP